MINSKIDRTDKNPARPGRVPAVRVDLANNAPVRSEGEYVLYWMTASRRVEWNFALERALEWAVALQKPLLILEALRAGYRWASARLHRFVLDGMADTARRLARMRGRGVHYVPYVEPRPGAGQGLLQALAGRACVVIADDSPAFFLRRMVCAAADRLPARMERVDGNGLLPLRATERVFTTARSFRAFLQKELPGHLSQFPLAAPLAKACLPATLALPPELLRRWPPATPEVLNSGAALAALPIDHGVAAVHATPGGSAAGRARLRRFLARQLPQYAALANDPDANVRSGLSPYLHFGHVAPHEAFHALAELEDWSPRRLGPARQGRREGFWGMSPAAEAWLDELITWRELGYNMAHHDTHYDRYESLPGWARVTLERRAADRRPYVYSLEQFAAAATHDALWNAAQRQLLTEGTIHGYLRMLWGKKILEWSASPREALDVMIELNNRFALDGRDPNSYSGIFWCLGRYDRPWGPERPIFGTVRYMSSENTARKHHLREYLRRYGPAGDAVDV